jgi:hypothetical protein
MLKKAVLGLAFSLFSLSSFANVGNPIQVSNIEQYNALQHERAFKAPLQIGQQKGDTCTYYQVSGALRALRQPVMPLKEFVKKTGGERNHILIDAAHTLGLSVSSYTGGFIGAAHDVVSGEFDVKKFGFQNALRVMEQGVDEGRIVLVGLHSGPLYDELMATNNTAYSGSGRHVVRVLGINRDTQGKVDKLHIYDTAYPTGRYTVSVKAFESAYDKATARLARSVMLTTDRVFPPIITQYKTNAN